MTESDFEFIPYGRHNINHADIQAVINALKSDFVTQGPAVPNFEKAICQEVGAAYGVAVNSATSALHIACLALGLGPGDLLWTSPITFVASANCALYCGAKVDFIDINPFTGLLDIEKLKYKLSIAEQTGNLPKILVPVHLAGTSCEMAAIHKLSKQYGFSVIEDASHAIGGKYQDHPVGDCRYSDICVFSFHPVKIITTGEGGMAITNNESLAHRMTQLRSHGIVKESSLFQYEPPGPWSYEQQQLGFNYRMTDLQAALGLSQLNSLAGFVTERNYIYQIYQKYLINSAARLLEIPANVYSSLHLGVIRLLNNSPQVHRFVFEYMRAHGIGVQLHYSPVHLQPFYRQYGFNEGYCPEAELYGLNAISLPLFPGLTEKQIRRVVNTLNESLAAVQLST